MKFNLTFFLILSLIAFQKGYGQDKKTNSVFDIRLSTFPTPDFSSLKPGGTTIAEVVELNYQIDSAFKLDKSYDFEFRLWELPMSYQVFVLRYAGGKWSARRFAETNIVNNTRRFGEKPVDQEKLTPLWYLLNSEKILTLPPESDLKAQLSDYIIDTATLQVFTTSREITDGVLYVY
ncbi:hypothetical protein [Pedobacter sp. BMA]|uniref:hypothetical protein n=1 Tax=Pedobacter sp. BMA TaxID=1663685 RepID=UPI00064A1B84|nr:hypothetical protein [Pedobacter sp. BMA]KLT64715.1 hypothetical protein AB669_13255 [Pedobacter sp. BMA]